MNPRTDCPRFEGTDLRPGCSAPICPMSAESLEHCAWFPDEDTCGLAQYRGTAMVRRQRKIARATGKDWRIGCFTAAMLAHPCTIKKGIRGLDPETEITSNRVQEWIAKRKVGRKLTASEVQSARARAEKARASRICFRTAKRHHTATPVADPAADVESSTPGPDSSPAIAQAAHSPPMSTKGYTA